MAGYGLDNHSAWLGVQVFPHARLEVFATTTYNQGRASIRGFDYSAGPLAALLPGLDYELQSRTFAGFSNLDIRRIGQTAGFTWRVSDSLAVNAMADYSRYEDRDPWLYDATGRYFNVFAGVSWIF
jgi:hypothetical protein